MSKVMLCADSESLGNPALLGLEGESLLSQGWIAAFSEAYQARAFLRDGAEILEAWVSSCDDMDAINAAAAFKRDRREMRVSLLVPETTGSLLSRANAAGIDAVLTVQDFVKSYSAAKARYALPAKPLIGSEGCSDDGASRSSERLLDDGGVSSGSELRSPTPPAAVAGAAVSKKTAGTFLLPVVSGSGGAGRSASCALAAVIAQRKGYSTLVIDMDLRFGDMKELLGLPNALPIDEAVKRPELLANVRPCEGKPALLAAPARLEAAEALVSKTAWLLDKVEGIYDVVVINTGACWDETHAVLLERATKVLFLIDQRVSSIRSCKHALELCERCGIATGSFAFALNRCSKSALFSSIDVSCALQGASVVELADGHPEVEEFMSTGKPEELLRVHNPYAESLGRMVSAMLPAPAVQVQEAGSAPRPSKWGIFGRRRSRKKGGDYVTA